MIQFVVGNANFVSFRSIMVDYVGGQNAFDLTDHTASFEMQQNIIKLYIVLMPHIKTELMPGF